MSLQSIFRPSTLEECIKNEKNNCIILALSMTLTGCFFLVFLFKYGLVLFHASLSLFLICLSLSLGSLFLAFILYKARQRTLLIRSIDDLKKFKLVLIKKIHFYFFTPYFAMSIWLSLNNDMKWGVILIGIWLITALFVYIFDWKPLLLRAKA